MGLFKASSYGNSTPSPAGYPHILLYGRLAHRCRVPIAPSVTSSNHSSVGSESGVHCQSKEVGAYPSEDARLPRSISRYPQVNRASGRAQSFGSSVAHSGTRRVSDGSCPPVAESSRAFGQPRGSGSKLQATHAASSVALPSILYSSVRLCQATKASLYTTHRRRDLALTALGFSDQQRTQLTRDMPCEGPFLFSGQFTPRLKEELAVRQQARELAGQLRQSQPPRYHSPGQPRTFPRAQAAPPRVTVTLPTPAPNRGARGGRGRSYRRGHRGQRGQRSHRQAAQGRGGF